MPAIESMADLPVPAAADAALRACASAWDDEATAERHLRTALAAAPAALAVRIGAYKFYFYRHRLVEAAEQARLCLGFSGDALGLPRDWQRVSAADSAFATLQALPRLYLQCLVAYGYCLLRLGNATLGRTALLHAASLDPADRLGARRLVMVLERGGRDEDDDF